MDEELIQTYLSSEEISQLRNLLTPGGSRGSNDSDYAAFERYVKARHFAIPWLERAIPLCDSTVLDFGCGGGSSATALAVSGNRVSAVDVDPTSLKLAAARAEIMGVADRVSHHLVDPTGDLPVEVSSGSYDMIVLFAVLGHMPLEQRIASLRKLWQLLPEGGLLAILDTPNRHCLWDYHASRSALFQLEPLTLQRFLVSQSPRTDFNTMDPVQDVELAESLQRWGHGISHNDIQYALGDDIFDTLVLDGLEQEMTNWYPPVYEDVLLYNFYRYRLPQLPVAFSRHNLNLLFRKGHSGGENYAQDPSRIAAYEDRMAYCSQRFKYNYFLPQASENIPPNHVRN